MDYASGSTELNPVDWKAHATLHRKGLDHGLLYEMTALRGGTLAEMIHFVLMLPREQQRDYVIQKAGDHLLDTHEILVLASRPDYPG